jgi:hypothetical protein
MARAVLAAAPARGSVRGRRQRRRRTLVLRALAYEILLAQEGAPGHTLQPTALVHEAFLRLVGRNAPDCRNRSQFYGVAANPY